MTETHLRRNKFPILHFVEGTDIHMTIHRLQIEEISTRKHNNRKLIQICIRIFYRSEKGKLNGTRKDKQKAYWYHRAHQQCNPSCLGYSKFDNILQGRPRNKNKSPEKNENTMHTSPQIEGHWWPHFNFNSHLTIRNQETKKA
jgi:hypothetical protein